MPFKSTAQRAYLAINKPAVAKEFAAATPKGAKLPEKVAPKKRKPYAIAAAEQIKGRTG